MSLSIIALPEAADPPSADSGLGALSTERGNLPLRGLDVSVEVTGLVATTTVTQRFHNPHAEPIEATYIFPLPDRAAVTAMTMTVADRVVTAELKERGEARQAYDQAISAGKRAAIAEAERADVFTMRVGNIAPGEEAVVALTTVGPLTYEDDEAGLRVPLVVAPRFIPGKPLPGEQSGDGVAPDTDAVPDASRITPPVLLPGFPNPVRLSIDVDIDPGDLTLRDVASSLHTVVTEESADGHRRLRVEPGERVDRDFILRFGYAEEDAVASTLQTADGVDGTTVAQVTVLPPTSASTDRAKDVVVLLDRSGSMGGWKMVAARRAAARIVDTLRPSDRFAVRCFDHEVTSPDGLGSGLVPATDRNRYRAVEHLARADARGGTVLLEPLLGAADVLSDEEHDRVLVLVTDGQVGNEDQILEAIAPKIKGVRVHVVGIDRAVNAGFLHRLAVLGRGRCEFVESEDRLDAACANIHRRIVAPVVTDCSVEFTGADVVAGSTTPSRIPDLFSGAPLVVRALIRPTGDDVTATVTGTDADGRPWRVEIPRSDASGVGIGAVWARGRLQDLQDRYAMSSYDAGALEAIEKDIVATSLDWGVLSRFTAFVAVDSEVVTEGGKPRTIVQPVEAPDGWQQPPIAAPGGMQPLAATTAWMSQEQARGGSMDLYGAPPPAAPMAPPPFAGAPIPPSPIAPGGPPPPAPGSAPRGAVRRRIGGAPKFGRIAPVNPVRPAPGPGPSIADDLADELRELRASTTSGGAAARMALGDLASRLKFVAERLDAVGEGLAARLRSLITRLEACEDASGDESPEAVRESAIEILAAVVAELRSPSDTDGGAAGERRPFWKRRA